MLAALTAVLGGIATQVAKNIFPDPADELKRLELENNLKLHLINSITDIIKAAADVVKTEAASSHWLAANWRPMIMCLFGFLITARWFGFSYDGMSPGEYQAAWELLQIGLGGYVMGRTVEKIAPGMIEAFKKK